MFGKSKKWTTVNKTTNTRVSVRVTEQLIKGNTKLKWTTFSASLSHTCSSKHQFQDSLCFCSVIGGTLEGREEVKESSTWLIFPPTTERFLWDPRQQTDGLWDPPFGLPSLLLLLEHPADHWERETIWERCLEVSFLQCYQANSVQFLIAI